jgi:hypothetical protein
MRIASRDRRASVRPCSLCRGGYGLCASDGRMQLGPRIDEAKRCPRLETYPTFLHHDKQGGFLATKREKAPPKIHSAQVIRTELDPLATAAEDLGANIVAPFRQPPRAKRTPTKASESPVFPPPAPIPAWARASGRRGRAIPCLPPAPLLRCSTLMCVATRPPPEPCAPAWRS